MTDQPTTNEAPAEPEQIVFTYDEGTPIKDFTDAMSLRLLDAIDAANEDQDTDMLLRIYADTTKAAATLHLLATEAEARVVAHLPDKEATTVEGLGVFSKRKPAVRTKWDNGVLDEYIKRAVEAGDINGPQDVPAKILEVVYAGTNFKVTKLAEYGIEAKDWRESEYGPAKLRWDAAAK